MRFLIEKMQLTDARGAQIWNDGPPPQYCCEADGVSGRSVLTRFVRETAGVELGAQATFKDGEAVTLAQDGKMLYALRAVPVRRSRTCLGDYPYRRKVY